MSMMYLLSELDKLSFFLCFNRKFHGHSSLKEYYEKESCVHYIHNVRFPTRLTTSRIMFLSFVSLCICLTYVLFSR